MTRRSVTAVTACALAVALGASCGSPPPPASAAQRARVDVTLYATRWCPACSEARAWLQRRGIPYHERDVEQSAAAATTHRRLNPSRTVPTFDVGGRIVVGFVPEELRHAIDRAAHALPDER